MFFLYLALFKSYCVLISSLTAKAIELEEISLITGEVVT